MSENFFPEMLFNHQSEVLFDSSPSVIAVDNVAENCKVRVGPFSYFLDDRVQVTGSLYAVVLSLQRDDYPFRGGQHGPRSKPEVWWCVQENYVVFAFDLGKLVGKAVV